MSDKTKKGGHAPEHLKKAMDDHISKGAKGKTVTVEGKEQPVDWLLVELWDCTDLLPSSGCEALGMEQGSTYAMAARKLKKG
jgi:hypothetical protein